MRFLFAFMCAYSFVYFLSYDLWGATDPYVFQLPKKRLISPIFKKQRSMVYYARALHKLLPCFKKYISYEIPVYNGDSITSKAIIMGYPRLCPTTYIIEHDQGIPHSLIDFSTVGHCIRGSPDSFWWIQDCFLAFPAFEESRYAPYNQYEAWFITSRELAHICRATVIRYQIELDPIHYPILLSNSRYNRYKTKKRSLLEVYVSLWPERGHQHNLAAIMLAISLGGPGVVTGAITYTARRLIYAYCAYETHKEQSLLNRAMMAKLTTIISNSTDIMCNILAWHVNKVLAQSSTTYKKLVAVRKKVSRYYRRLVSEIPELHYVAGRHKDYLLELGAGKRVKLGQS
jgi:hypothetical protein